MASANGPKGESVIHSDGTHDVDIRFLLGIEDMSCIVADALRQLGSGRALGLPGIFPHGSRKRACGPAFTVRYEACGADRGHTTEHRLGAAFDFRALFAGARRGEVAVFDCPVQDVAVLGSMGVAWARHFGVTGCVVNGAVRDVEAVAASEIPVWARHVTPVGGRGSLIQAEVGGPISLGGAMVNPGDIVVADGNGVAVIPAGSLDAVARMVADLQQAETASAGAFEVN
jgi:regulator of RNase E activity RraA